jgi:hypothetical protein
MTITRQQAQELLSESATVYSAAGKRIGSMGQIYVVDDKTGDPSWVTIETGLFGLKTSFAPLEGARIDDEGLHLGVDEEAVKDAPRIDPDGSLSPAEEEQLYRHYGLDETEAETDTEAAPDGADEVAAPAEGRFARLRKYVSSEHNAADPDKTTPDAPPRRA